MNFPLASALTDWIQAVAVAGGVVIAALGTIIAARGLTTWREQLHGNARHDAGTELLCAALHLRQTLQKCRRTMTFGAVFDKDDLPAQRELRRSLDEPVQLAMERLDAAIVRAEVFLGGDVDQVLDPVWLQCGRIRAAIDNEITRRAGHDAPKDDRRLGTWVSNDPDRDPGSKTWVEALAPLRAWVKERNDAVA